MLSLVYLYVFDFGLLVFMSCVNYIMEKKKKDDQAYLDLWHSQNSSFKNFQLYLGLFRYIDAYSTTVR